MMTFHEAPETTGPGHMGERVMKLTKIVAAVLAVVLMTGLAQAQSTKQEKTTALIRAAGVTQAVDAMIPMTVQSLRPLMMQAVPGATDEQINAALKAVENVMLENKDSFIQMMVPVYQNNLSEKEIDEALAFFTSPSGRSLVAKQPKMLQEGAVVGQKWAQLLKPAIQQKVVEELEKLRGN